MKLRISTWLLPALGLMLCSGCMTYRLYDDNNKRPQGELATVKLGVILEINGGNLQYLTGHNLLVSPGRHTLGLTTQRGRAAEVACTFDVVLEAGHLYAGVVEPDKTGSGMPPVIYVKDKTADVVVARHPPLPTMRAKARTAKAVPAAPAQAARKSAAPLPASPTPRQDMQLDAETLAKLRKLRQLRTDGLITHDEYLRRGHALVDTL